MKMTAEEFNKLYPIGTTVHYHPMIGRENHIVTKTRSSAWSLPSGQEVVMVEGRAGGVALEAISFPEES
jgi:hypothetical protein